METYQGKAIYKGIAIGEIFFYSKEGQPVKRIRTEDTKAELARYEKAKEKALEELGKLYAKAAAEVGEMNAQIFEVHAMMLKDEDFHDSVVSIIQNQQVNAEYAVAVTGDNLAEMFAGMDDDYMKARSADVKDISERLLTLLGGKGANVSLGDKSCIIAAKDLSPSETVQLDKRKVLAFVTRQGSSNSHTAILARTMNIPALIGVEIDRRFHGKTAIVDGYSGKLIVEPDEETKREYEKKQREEQEKKKLYQSLKGKEDVTKSGQQVKLYANIGNVTDLAAVLQNDAAGIGLFRSEFLYLEKEAYPTEEEQFQVYKKVAQTMAGKQVIIRTLDIGADKQAGYFKLEKEENPAMGLRAIRICLTRQDVFKTQLRALFRAAAFGNLGIMYPMIISVDEVKQIKALAEAVKEELRAEGIPFGNVQQGIMIETPAAAIISDLLAKEVDFFSIGTNDLTQYTLAIDRQNPKLEPFFDAHHEAVLRLIETVVKNGHQEGIWVGICGELGADTKLTGRFLEMGLDELSVSPSMVLPVRKAIREHL